MASWCNARLIVVGPRSVVLHFSRRARAKPSPIFTPDMLVGEAQELFSERIERWAARTYRKKYVFQVRSDDGRDHFQEISLKFTSPWFVLVFGDPDLNDYGSYVIRQGRSRSYSVPDKLKIEVMARHGAEDITDDEDDWRFWDASWELMDLAQVHWDRFLLKQSSPDLRKAPRSSTRSHSTR